MTGALLAIAAAWIGGWFDATLAMVFDVMFAFPAILLAVVAAAVFGPGLTSAICALSIAYLPYVARVLRGAGLRERSQPYVEALEVQGLSATRICLRHLLPNVGSLVVAQGTILFGWAMVDLAAISFLGLGVQAPQADWGVMLADGKVGVLEGYPLEAVSAAVCIVVVVTAVSLLASVYTNKRKMGVDNPSAESHLLELDGLTVRLPVARVMRTVLDRVSLTVDRGESVGLVGESGSGSP